MSRPPRDPHPAAPRRKACTAHARPPYHRGRQHRAPAVLPRATRPRRAVERRAATLPRKSSGAGATKPADEGGPCAGEPWSGSVAALRDAQARTLLSQHMHLRDLGEFALIARIERAARRVTGRGVALGIGDDAALLRARRGETLGGVDRRADRGRPLSLEQRDARTVGRPRSPRRSPTSPRWARGRAVHLRARGAPATPARGVRRSGARPLVEARGATRARSWAATSRARGRPRSLDRVRRSRAAARCAAARAWETTSS